MMQQIEHLETVEPRKLFANEAGDFTTRRDEHIEVLGDRLGLTLSNAEREQAVGSFSIDLRAEDGDGRLVVIENQGVILADRAAWSAIQEQMIDAMIRLERALRRTLSSWNYRSTPHARHGRVRRNPERTGSCYSVLPDIPKLLPDPTGLHEAPDDC